MDKYRKGAVIALIVFVLQSLLVAASEIPLIPANQKLEYFTMKLSLTLGALPLAYGLWRNYSSPWLHTLVMLDFFGYTLLGQVYRPLYYFAFFQLVTLVAFLFAVPKRIFNLLLLVWSGSFILVIHLKWQQYVLQMQHPVFSDIVLSITSVALVAWLCHFYFTSDRLFREAALSKFGRIGMHSARLVHDLKGLTSAPKLYAQMLEERLTNLNDPMISEALSHLSRDLSHLSQVVIEMNQMTAMRDGGRSVFTAAEIFQSLTSVIGNHCRGVRVECTGPIRFNADRAIFNSVFLNLLLNSIDSLRDRAISHPEVSLDLRGQYLVFSDNGGGFDRSVLESFRSERFMNTKCRGSGLGLWFIHDCIRELGGRMRIYNESARACVELALPKGMVELHE